MVKKKKFINSHKGAIMPIVAIILGLFALGFIALVIDLGNVYIQRKKMVTSADAAALAGAQVLKENQEAIRSMTKSITEVENAAKIAAEQYAAKNGAEQINVTVGLQPVTIKNDKNETVTETREVVNVTAGKNEPSIFARFLGSDSTNVKANAISTWGYDKKSYIGNFIPLFTFSADYQSDTNVYLHDKLTNSNCNYGYVDIGAGMGDIKMAIAGTKEGGSYVYNNLLGGKPGAGESLYTAVVDRMIEAQKKPTADERKNYMIGLVPVVDSDHFGDDIYDNFKNDGVTLEAQLKLPIKWFAYYEIIDVIKQKDIMGSMEALNPGDGYQRIGSSYISYADKLPSSFLNSSGTVDDTTIIGRFTGVKVDPYAIPTSGDQEDPNPGGDVPQIYVKLLK